MTQIKVAVLGSDGTVGGPGGSPISAQPVANTVPEFYGPTGDDWGPAINAAIVACGNAGVDVVLRDQQAISYGIRTTIVWPAGSAVALNCNSGQARLYKLQDVTLVDCSGTSSVRQYNRRFKRIYFDGGNTPGWTQPLFRCDYTSQTRTFDCTWWQNYGAAVTAKQAWDTIHTNGSFMYCGGTDGATPAVSLNATSGDAGNATNNQWFVNCRFEGWRTGAVWAVGGDTNSYIKYVKLLNAKIEISGGAPEALYGPAIKLGYVQKYTAQSVQFVTNVSSGLGTGQSTPFDAWYWIYGSQAISLGDMWGDVGNVTAGQLASLIHFDGATSANSQISWTNVALKSGSGSQVNAPACVFLWSGTNSFVNRGGVEWNSNFWLVPTDSSSPSSLEALPVVSGVTDAVYNTTAGRFPVDGDSVWDSAVSQLLTRISGVWKPAGAAVPLSTYQFVTTTSTINANQTGTYKIAVASGAGGGGGGGSGNAAQVGGGGGGQGTEVYTHMALTAGQAVVFVIGGGGSGQAGGSGGGAGTTGNPGGQSSVTISSVAVLLAAGGGGGAGGGANSAVVVGGGVAGRGAQTNVNLFPGTGGSSGFASGGPLPSMAATGGGGGGAASGGNGGTGGAAGAAGQTNGIAAAGGNGTNGGVNGGNGANAAANSGGGGGGGGGSQTGTGGTGGTGGSGYGYMVQIA